MTSSHEKNGLFTAEPYGIAGMVFVSTFLWFFFWMHGQPLFDDDYGRWLLPAIGTPYANIIHKIIIPFPGDWGFLDRPVVTLIIKTAYGLFGINPAAYFAIKSLIVSVLAALLFWFGVRHAGYRSSGKFALVAAPVSVLFFLSSLPVFMSVLWFCDLEILAQLCLAVCLAIYMHHRSLLGRIRPFGAKSVAMMAAIFAVAVIGYKTKATAKIIPAVLLFHLIWDDRKALKYYLPLIVALAAITVPWAKIGVLKAPVFMSLSGRGPADSFLWQPANLKSLAMMLVGDMGGLWFRKGGASAPHGLLQILFPFGLICVAAALWVVARKGLRGPEAGFNRLAVVWLIFFVIPFPIYPTLPGWLMIRYLAPLYLPVILLLISAMALLLKSGKRLWPAIFIATIAAHFLVGSFQILAAKKDYGYNIILVDRFNEYVADNLSGSDILLVGEKWRAYFKTGAGNRYFTEKYVYRSLLDGYSAASGPGRRVYVAVRNPDIKYPFIDRHIVSIESSAYFGLLGSYDRRKDIYVYRIK